MPCVDEGDDVIGNFIEIRVRRIGERRSRPAPQHAVLRSS
jgi:hypothetical protein